MNFSAWLDTLGHVPFLLGAVFALGISIFVHELGHFLAARRRGLKVTRFSIGMGPKVYAWTRGGVEYRLSLLPIGGYVALPQLADMGRLEGSKEGQEPGEDEEQEEPLPPISFADKVIVSVMGAVFNFIFAFLLAMVLWVTGQPTSEEMLTTRVGYVQSNLNVAGNSVPGPAHEAGLRPGDRILEVDGARVQTFMAIQQKVLTGVGRDEQGNPRVEFKIERAGQEMDLTVRPAIAFYNSASRDPIRTIGIAPASVVKLHTVSEGSPAQKAGLLKGDIIRSVNGNEVLQLQTFIDMIAEKENGPARIMIERDGAPLEITLQPITVALTKPLLSLKIQRGGEDSILRFRPDFPEGSSERKTDPEARATVVLHEVVRDEATVLDRFRLDDRIVAINGEAVDSLVDAKRIAQEAREPMMQVTIARGGGTQTIPVVFSTISTEIESPITQPMVGFSIARETVISHVDPFTQFGQQIDMTFRILKALFHRGSEIGIGHLSGPIGIVRQLTEITRIDLRLALSFLILMNVNLGILNLLPIPILDGGHILFAIIGRIRRRELPFRLVAGIQGAFMLMLLSLMVFVLFKDSVRWHGDNQYVDRVEMLNKLYIEPVFLKDGK